MMHRSVHRYHATFGYHFVPNVKARLPYGDRSYLVRTNPQGFRSDHDFTEQKRPGTFRVLAFGDSFTAGVGVSNGQRYSEYLEEMIPGLEVYNCGLEGSGTDQQYLIFREVAPLYEHDLVIAGVWVENIRRIVSRSRVWSTSDGEHRIFPKPYFTLEQGDELRLHNVPVPESSAFEELDEEARGHIDRGGPGLRLRELVYRLPEEHRLRVTRLMQRLTRYQPVPGYARPDSPEWLLMRAILERWARESEQPVLVMAIPMPQYVDGTASARDVQRRFQELAQPPALTVHDPLDDLRAYSPAERRGFRDPLDPHPTPAGHRALAESLAPRIRAAMARAGIGSMAGAAAG